MNNNYYFSVPSPWADPQKSKLLVKNPGSFKLFFVPSFNFVFERQFFLPHLTPSLILCHKIINFKLKLA